MNRIGLIVSSLLLIVVIFGSTLFVVDQRQFAVVYALGEIKEVINEPGLKVKLPPPFQNVEYLDRRILTTTLLAACALLSLAIVAPARAGTTGRRSRCSRRSPAGA